jgi:hypothetical protein
MYSTDVPYTDIKAARPALTTFAAQLIEKRLLKEMREVTKSNAGLHVWSPARNGNPGYPLVKWDDLGVHTVSDAADVQWRSKRGYMHVVGVLQGRSDRC